MKKTRIEDIKETGFRVPDNYFKDFEDTLLSELKLKETVGKSGFKVPADYFESLDESIYSSISEKKQVKVINLFSWKKAIYTTSIAASLILMFTVLYNKKDSLTLDSIETASIENYILNEDIESTDMSSLLTNEDLADFDNVEINFNSESLENYVFDNVEIDDIISN
ncbi:hypothetical protein [Yeosuana sp.]|uniref:hypothetical protein n=1 Tax=Yeosuana sp. TaxID=2529388 RepID=UPI004054D6CE|tara:strand:- start:915 stop:1415 length:501 start_codon:yes stop_codon:yes gene_type:complete